ncbi:MAG: hypothetical protein LAT50_12500 [Ectothiorhodospiraceae bacterium]|nr:hypothetical protein [Ectothiorhodospiraceae bacterium]
MEGTPETLLELRAGPAALRRIRDQGLNPGMVRGLAGAAGGPKWLGLNHLDRMLFGEWLPRVSRPRFLIGSSIATWRFACGAQRNPEAAYQRFEHTYIHEQRYGHKPSPSEVSAEARRLLDVLLGEKGTGEILSSAAYQLHVMTVRCRGLLTREGKPLLLGLLGAAAKNSVSRQKLGAYFERALFSLPDAMDALPQLQGFGLSRHRLGPENLRAALLASGSIPMVMEPEHDIPGAAPGVYRAGGLLDYQMDIAYGVTDGIVLMPHYAASITPGWFDKMLPWRRARGGNVDPVLLVAPSESFVRQLPRGRIPDRKDFYRYAGDDAGRARDWQRITDATRRLADGFLELCESDRIRQVVKPLGKD